MSRTATFDWAITQTGLRSRSHDCRAATIVVVFPVPGGPSHEYMTNRTQIDDLSDSPWTTTSGSS